MSYLHGPAQVDACFNGDIVGGLEESPLQEQGKEEQHGQHISILQKFFGGNEIDPPQSHLKAQKGGGGHKFRPVYHCWVWSLTQAELGGTEFDLENFCQ